MPPLKPQGQNIDPAYGAFQIYPSDTNRFAFIARAIYVGVTGNIHLLTVNNEEVTLMNVTAGMIYPIMAAQVFETGTTASSLVALY